MPNRGQRIYSIVVGKLGEIRRADEIGSTAKAAHYYKYIYAACVDCGKERWVLFTKGNPVNPRCNRCAKKGERNGCWNSGKTTQRGYISVRLNPTDFFYQMTPKGLKGYVSEHRLVMARHLNRCLLSWEVVHHKNGIKDDNRIENLELLPSRKYHLPDTVMKSRIALLEKRVSVLEAENILLRYQLSPTEVVI